MSDEPISAAVRAFIGEHIQSVVELECLLLLHKDAAREWSAAELGRELRVDEQWTTGKLMDLSRRGLAIAGQNAPTHYHYAARTLSLDESVQQLAVLYAERRISVIELIYARASDPIQNFADAFRFRKERPNG